MKIIKTKIKDLLILKSKKFNDKRGFVRELYRRDILNKDFRFDILSLSKKNVLRGLHFQTNYPQAKLITVTNGKIFDVAVDLRKNSKTFGKYVSIILSEKDDFSFFIPENFAHGFLCMSKSCTIHYKLSNYRKPKFEKTLKWNDPNIDINWPTNNPILSKKDKENCITFEGFNS